LKVGKTLRAFSNFSQFSSQFYFIFRTCCWVSEI